MDIIPPTPGWLHDAVFYQIYPQTFFDTNGDGIGDLEGIIQKLDYIKSLGVSGIWLSPFYQSPFRDAGYDVSDYCKVHPRYGTNDDARRLFAEARERGLQVLIDFVPGHTSIDHPWFQESAKPEPNKYTNWYVWTPSAWYMAGDTTGGKVIHGYSDRNGNYMFNFFWSQPSLNFGFAQPAEPWQLPTTHPDVQALWAEMKNVIAFWMELGATGFRCDMAGSITKNDPGKAEARRFWKETRVMAEKINPEVFFVAEWSAPQEALDGTGFHADFLHWIPSYESLLRAEKKRRPETMAPDKPSFFDRRGEGDISRFMADYLELYRATRAKGYISIPVANHDLPRIAIDRTPAELEIIQAFLLAMPGVPFMYYGDEIGMRQLHGVKTREGSYPPRSGARTPMQWSAGENLGFSAAAPDRLWAPVDSADDAPTVAAQEGDPESLLNRIRHLAHLRRTEPALRAYADLEILYCEKDKYPLIFERRCEGARILVVLNPADREFEVGLPVKHPTGAPVLLAGFGCSLGKTDSGEMIFRGQGCSYGIFRMAF